MHILIYKGFGFFGKKSSENKEFKHLSTSSKNIKGVFLVEKTPKKAVVKKM